MTAATRAPRIKVPADAVRTPEHILANLPATHYRSRTLIWVPCWNCGGSGTYPSAMTPPGMCRLYCWAGPHTNPLAEVMGGSPPPKSPDDPTYGKLAMSIDKYVKKQQAADRADYRAKVRYELDAPARAERERIAAENNARIEAENAERARLEAERLAVSQHIGAVGERITRDVLFVDVRSFDTKFGRMSVLRFRDDAGNVLTWFTGSGIDAELGERVKLVATIKAHDEYKGERQTVVTRAKVAP